MVSPGHTVVPRQWSIRVIELLQPGEALPINTGPESDFKSNSPGSPFWSSVGLTQATPGHQTSCKNLEPQSFISSSSRWLFGLGMILLMRRRGASPALSIHRGDADSLPCQQQNPYVLVSLDIFKVTAYFFLEQTQRTVMLPK